ncbi:SGNH hydrolase-type esterase domain-containing protein [Sphaerosporella brunnea]|uniref:SGNH hydrolase-type esterase domain-containing protein n=1 Tax=Sphaerosporella brunnea TaxID=1250544 RepID=A0A5J5EB76_9PEZI|nr:SGNH hydrolase-type esterase domain-containing protein [Sphaerosporella brunnea]
MHPQSILGPALYASNMTHHTLVTFGDSYTDTGFAASGPSAPSPHCPLGNPGCHVGESYTGGHNWLSALTSVFNATTTVAWNLAHSGDVISTALVPERGGGAVEDQLPQLLGGAARLPPADGAQALWSAFVGVNDLGATRQAGRDPGDAAFVRRLVERYFDALLGRAYERHAARWFLVWTIPDTSRTPQFWRDEPLRRAVAAFNAALRAEARSWEARRSGARVLLLDAEKLFDDLLRDPAAGGWKDDRSVCPADECFWYDRYHPGEKVHMVMAQKVARVLADAGWW